MALDKLRLTRPAGAGVIAASIVAALLLRLLPWSGWGLALRPDFVLLALLYWGVHRPTAAGLGLAFFLGLLTDATDGLMLGQYALAYVVASFVTLLWHRRLRVFLPWQQALHVLILLLAVQLLVVFTGTLAGRGFDDWSFFLSSVTGALLWPGLSVLLDLPQRRVARQEIQS
jgi:rod shape-determining protein MreD